MNESAIQNIGGKLHAEFDKNAALRRPFEQRWIDDLRQYQGVYPPEVLKKLTEQNRSTLYLRKTKAKVDSIKAHLMDLLFPAKGERNWDISPSTTPEVHPSLLFEARGMMEAHMGRRLNAAELRSLTLSLAADAASGMGDEMENQLAEGPGRKAYRATCESLIFQGVLFGTGVLKGPLVERRKREKFAYSDASGWALGSDEGPLWPYTEFVSIWDVYPDLTSTTVEGLRYVWQTHMKNQQELLELETWPGFNAAAIRAHITEVPDGDAELVQHEADKRQVSNDDGRQVPTSLPGRWRLMERWGYLPGKDLVDAGIEDIDPTEVYPANVWLLGTKVIKAVLAPIEGIDIPYNFFFYSEDETAFFPEGVASIIRHPEKAFNAAMRMVLDNAAICSGPQFGVNMSALHDGTNPDEQYPFKVWKFKSGADLAAAFRVYEINSSIPDLTQVAKLMADWSDEVTTPRFMSGDSPTRGAAETASGLSMLMGAANITLKGLVNQFDNNVTRPFITNLYYWNMKFNPREDIKGDFVIKAVGASALMTREIQAQNVMKALQASENPRFRPYVKDPELITEAFKLMDLGPSVLRSKEEAEQFRQEEIRQQAQANVEAVLAEAAKRGIPLPQAVMNMLAVEGQKLGIAPAQGVPDGQADQYGAPQAQEGGEGYGGAAFDPGGGQGPQISLGA